jgi:hypothetical protein
MHDEITKTIKSTIKEYEKTIDPIEMWKTPIIEIISAENEKTHRANSVRIT